MSDVQPNDYHKWLASKPAKLMLYLFLAGWLLAIPVQAIVGLVFHDDAKSNELWQIGLVLFIPYFSMTIIWLKRGIQLRRKYIFEWRVKKIMAETFLEIIAPEELNRLKNSDKFMEAAERALKGKR
jgi:hypothetical protein